MEKINYTLTLDDCNNYARSQCKIPRLKKYSSKQFFKLCLMYIVFLTILAFVSFCIAIYSIKTNNHITLFSLLTNNGFPHFLISQIKFYFLWIIIYTFIFFVVLHFIRYFSSGRLVYNLLSGVDLNY